MNQFRGVLHKVQNFGAAKCDLNLFKNCSTKVVLVVKYEEYFAF